MSQSLSYTAWLRLRRRPSALIGLAVVIGFILLAILAPYISPQDPIATSWGAIRKAPSAAHWFGTDEIGRDVLSRVIWGTQASLMAGVISVSISLLIGVPLGSWLALWAARSMPSSRASPMHFWHAPF